MLKFKCNISFCDLLRFPTPQQNMKTLLEIQEEQQKLEEEKQRKQQQSQAKVCFLQVSCVNLS